MLGILIGAAILGIIIAVMEGDFPGWPQMIVCVLCGAIPAAIINAVIQPGLFIIGLVIGAVCAGIAIAATCGMSVKRACIAASIYFVIQSGISTAFYFMAKK